MRNFSHLLPATFFSTLTHRYKGRVGRRDTRWAKRVSVSGVIVFSLCFPPPSSPSPLLFLFIHSFIWRKNKILCKSGTGLLKYRLSLLHLHVQILSVLCGYFKRVYLVYIVQYCRQWLYALWRESLVWDPYVMITVHAERAKKKYNCLLAAASRPFFHSTLLTFLLITTIFVHYF